MIPGFFLQISYLVFPDVTRVEENVPSAELQNSEATIQDLDDFSQCGLQDRNEGLGQAEGVVEPDAEHVQGQLVGCRTFGGDRNILRVPCQPVKIQLNAISN